MLTELEYEQYLLYKLWLALIFESEIPDVVNINRVRDVGQLKQLKKIIEAFIEFDSLSSQVKNNIYCIVNELREIEDEYKDERNQIISEIIILLNQYKDKFPVFFYVSELYKRTDDKRCIYKYNLNDILDKVEVVNDSICMDAEVLISHNDKLSEEEFEENYFEEFVNNMPFYYKSLNVLLREYPIIFKNSVFYNRMIKIMNKGYEISKDREINSINKKFIKEINKKVKKI